MLTISPSKTINVGFSTHYFSGWVGGKTIFASSQRYATQRTAKLFGLEKLTSAPKVRKECRVVRAKVKVDIMYLYVRLKG